MGSHISRDKRGKYDKESEIIRRSIYMCRDHFADMHGSILYRAQHKGIRYGAGEVGGEYADRAQRPDQPDRKLC